MPTPALYKIMPHRGFITHDYDTHKGLASGGCTFADLAKEINWFADHSVKIDIIRGVG